MRGKQKVSSSNLLRSSISSMFAAYRLRTKKEKYARAFEEPLVTRRINGTKLAWVGKPLCGGSFLFICACSLAGKAYDF